jgi:hypothetical protein
VGGNWSAVVVGECGGLRCGRGSFPLLAAGRNSPTPPRLQCIVGTPPRSRPALRDDRLDFIVVVTSLLSAVPGMPKVSALRLFRALRPLRSLHMLPGLKKLINALLSSITHLLGVAALTCFCFVIFGILGLQVCECACLGAALAGHCTQRGARSPLPTPPRLNRPPTFSPPAALVWAYGHPVSPHAGAH